MKNIFVIKNSDKNKLNRELKIINNYKINFISNEIDRFYPNIQELRKLKEKKPIIKNMTTIILKKLKIKQNKKRLLKSTSIPMI